ncbi:hypothetical protein AL755_08540 [Arthrobacter sp. ERGS1:01]|uniref:hypothetical protein n=1 Tax=Arthrobacter sp. ERGS1:01 TaxID=1704044 RepID=UPI0006B637C2|nr:hypothetical protein [Arthrobacter sp. ERGS1:01]ALE05516.1 hypothetical protein AL755_08540 [Arthrobacter sp. ERGS1:01]
MRELKVLTGKRVIVVTADTALAGVLESATRAAVTLCDAAAVDGPQPVPVDGFVIVPVSRISYVQVP